MSHLKTIVHVNNKCEIHITCQSMLFYIDVSAEHFSPSSSLFYKL